MVATSPGMVEVEGRAKKGPKMLQHLEIHPGLKGGHMVRHVYSGYKHDPSEYHFKAGEQGRMVSHIQHHLGLKAVKGEGSAHENANDAETE